MRAKQKEIRFEAPVGFSQKALGVFLTIAFIIVIEVIKDAGIVNVIPPAILLTTVIFSAFKGGWFSGMISGLFTLIYFTYHFSEPYGLDNLPVDTVLRLAIWGVTIPFMVWMVASLKGRLIDRAFVEKHLRENDRRTRLFVNSIQDYAIFMLDPSGEITNWNEGAERITGYASNDILGEHFSILYMTRDRDVSRIDSNLETARSEGRFEDEGWRLRKNGTRFWANEVITPVIDEDGDLTGFTKIVRDVTERKLHEEELKKAKDFAEKARFSAEEANRAKTNFLANISHEIRTPLGVILGYAELMCNPNQTRSDRLHSIGIIKRNGELLSRIINDILDLSKIEASRIDVELERFPLPAIISDINDMFSHQAREKGIGLHFRNDGPFPEFIRTDPTRLRQVLMNLVGNAVKFTDHGSVSVTLSLAFVGNGHQIHFVISDQGPGMTLDQMARLFRPFEQADTSPTRKFGETGLGLALSRRLAKALGGDLNLLSTNPGAGSTFALSVDSGSIEDSPMQTELKLEDKTMQAPPEVTLESSKLDGVHVLVVEDIPDNQLLISRFLKMAGATVDLAKNGHEALEKLADESSFDVVLMDIQMPELDGYQATERLRNRGYNKPIIALTAHAMKEERDHCLRVGCDDHLTKPIHREALIDRVAMFAGKRHLKKVVSPIDPSLASGQ